MAKFSETRADPELRRALGQRGHHQLDQAVVGRWGRAASGPGRARCDPTGTKLRKPRRSPVAVVRLHQHAVAVQRVGQPSQRHREAALVAAVAAPGRRVGAEGVEVGLARARCAGAPGWCSRAAAAGSPTAGSVASRDRSARSPAGRRSPRRRSRTRSCRTRCTPRHLPRRPPSRPPTVRCDGPAWRQASIASGQRCGSPTGLPLARLTEPIAAVGDAGPRGGRVAGVPDDGLVPAGGEVARASRGRRSPAAGCGPGPRRRR